MAIRVTGAEIVHVTPELAEKYLHDNKYPRQRGVNVHRRDQYAADMQGGDFLPGTALEFTCFEGETFLTNGQHRLEAIILSGIPSTMVLIRREVDTLDELAKIYYNTDMGLGRSFSQIFRSVGAGDKLGIPEYLAMRAAHALNFRTNGFRHLKQGGTTKDQILRLLLTTYSDALPQYRNAVSVKVGGIYSSMWRASVCAIGLETFRYASKKAQGEGNGDQFQKTVEFWSGLVLGDRLSMDDPRLVAREHILGTTLGDEKGVERVTSNRQARYIAACWNAWFEGRSLNVNSRSGPVRITDENGPTKILGTPWDGTIKTPVE